MSAATSTRTNEQCCNKGGGPGYSTPLEAMKGEREKLLYVVMVSCDETKPDYLATIDCDETSPTYKQVIHRLYALHTNDEFHHFGWNVCASCHGDNSKKRRFIILGGLTSSRIYIVDTEQANAPKFHKIIEPEEIKKWNFSAPHTVHCLGTGEIMISMLGDANGDTPGGFLLLDENFNITGPWNKEKTPVEFYYDYWYKPRHNIMISSEWAAPNTFKPGFKPTDVTAKKYGQRLHFWDWDKREYKKTIDLGEEGLVPLELRFCHDPNNTNGFVVAALGGSLIRFYKNEKDGEWKVETVAQMDPDKTVSMPAVSSDMLISLDDRFVYLCNWLHGDVRQYDVTDPSKPKLTGQVWLGGLSNKNDYKLNHPDRNVNGAPQMIQLSLDGKRLYVTNSLFSSWDDQFYPNIKTDGSYLARINCNTTESGGMELDEDFFINFKNEPNGPARAHEVRYPGGDCTSDIWY
ncbi:unnamed protein product [Didymodactylos carnosus]|uniref:Methanethiol oxidase n=1 Tax=Didymodactylos carnosus TaxID=1234261 RepID=A0A813SHR9_9BILA|nr:unnamed protein product [Didymodactylos carnosus]CAF0817719.1 unnamed protein product [Didymodactylos carnosus]CAF3580846.1 unnamed protein product [Didymodactylos carnosus]CAF3601823.1 unnamed protein product [Didymodactylos carnosus]